MQKSCKQKTFSHFAAAPIRWWVCVPTLESSEHTYHSLWDKLIFRFWIRNLYICRNEHDDTLAMPGTVVKKKNTATEVQSSFLVNSVWECCITRPFSIFLRRSQLSWEVTPRLGNKSVRNQRRQTCRFCRDILCLSPSNTCLWFLFSLDTYAAYSLWPCYDEYASCKYLVPKIYCMRGC